MVLDSKSDFKKAQKRLDRLLSSSYPKKLKSKRILKKGKRATIVLPKMSGVLDKSNVL